jgi:DNA-binding PadR family transcriptional regulator
LTRDAVNPLFEKHGLDEPGMFWVVYRATGYAPEPISVESFTRLDPYSNPARYGDWLSRAVEVGLIRESQDGGFELTENGSTALQEANHAFYTRLGEIEALPGEDMERLVGLLNKVAQACLEAGKPVEKGTLTVTHQVHPSQEYAPLAKLDQHLDDLRAFRDDAHLAAWKPYGVSGYVWEALTYLWRGDASTAEELLEALPRRGHSVETYEEALSDLAGRGWIEGTPDGYRLTEEGEGLRAEAEEATDRFFYAPWACLDELEIAQLHRTVTQLKDDLEGMVEREGADS